MLAAGDDGLVVGETMSVTWGRLSVDMDIGLSVLKCKVLGGCMKVVEPMGAPRTHRCHPKKDPKGRFYFLFLDEELRNHFGTE